MQNPSVLVCCLSLIFASVLGTSATAQELCDPNAAGTVQILKEEALAELQALQKAIGDDATLGPASDAFITLGFAIQNLTDSLKFFEVDPCTVTGDEAETLFDGFDFEEVGIELVMDLRSEEFLPDGPFVDTAEAAVKKTLEADVVLIRALLSRLPEDLSADASGSSSGTSSSDATLSDLQTAVEACKLPPRGATRENDGTCDDAAGVSADIVELIIVFI